MKLLIFLLIFQLYQFTELSMEVNIILPIVDHEGSLSDQCEPLEVDHNLCADIGYDHVHLPNFRHHTSQEEARMELKDFELLMQSGCSPYIKHFLCGYYLPICFNRSESMEPLVLKPCTSLCEFVTPNCSTLVEKNNHTWPTFLNCSLDSFREDNCFGPPAFTFTSSGMGLYPFIATIAWLVSLSL